MNDAGVVKASDSVGFPSSDPNLALIGSLFVGVRIDQVDRKLRIFKNRMTKSRAPASKQLFVTVTDQNMGCP